MAECKLSVRSNQVTFCNHLLLGLGGLVVTHLASGAKGPGFNFLVARDYLDLILGSLNWQASSVGYALYGCNKL